jgi:hypothetical protein
LVNQGKHGRFREPESYRSKAKPTLADKTHIPLKVSGLRMREPAGDMPVAWGWHFDILPGSKAGDSYGAQARH